MVFRTLLLILIFFSLAPTVGLSRYTVKKSGNPIIDKQLKDKIGKELDFYELDQIVKSLTQDGLFQMVSVELLNGNTVRIVGEESIRLSKILITGNVNQKKEDVIKRMGISTGKFITNMDINEAIERIRESYRDSGFYNFNIKHRVRLNNGQGILVVNINEQATCSVENVRIFSSNEKLNEILNKNALKYLKKPYGERTAQDIEKDLTQSLLKMRYLTARVKNNATVFNQSKTKVKLSFTVSNPEQYEFIFNGNTHFNHFDLLKTSGVGSKFLYLSDSSSEIVESIVERYRSAGYVEVKVKTREQVDAQHNKKVLVFEITEGRRFRIGKFQISGKFSKNKNFYIKRLESLLSEKEHNLFYSKEDVDSAAQELIRSLKREGHLQAELMSLAHDLKDNGFVDIKLQIDEGILTYVRQILFRGAKSFSNIKLREIVEIEPNKPLLLEKIEESFDKLSQFYQEEAFLEFKILNPNASVIKYKPGQPYADIVYEISEGPKISVKDIMISGNKKTKEYVIVREVSFQPGEILKYSKVQLTVERLERTGLFSKVNIKSLEQGTKVKNRTIIVEVEERRPGLFSSGVGILNSGLMTYRGYVGALYSNLGGKARGLSGRADLEFRKQIEYPEHRIALGYYEPFLTKDRLRGRVSLVRDQSLWNPRARTILSTNEIRLSTEKEFSRHLRFTYNVWGISNQEIFVYPRTAAPTVLQNVGYTGPVLELDYRNDPFLPTSGTYSRFEFEYSDPLFGSSRDNPAVNDQRFTKFINREDKKQEINYFKLSASTTLFTPLTKNRRWVWVNSLRGGYLKNVSSRQDSGVPQVRSFVLGGSSTIRGFSFGEIVPGMRELCIEQGVITKEQETGQCQISDLYIRDDSTFLLLKSEIRFPISGAIGGLFFYDGGAVYMGDYDLQDPYRDAVGFGVRFETPVGDFRAEVGYKLDRKLGGLNTIYDNEGGVAIHLAIGNF